MEASVDPQELCSWQEELDRDILARTEPYVVKLYGRDDADQPLGEFSGILHAPQPLIWTMGHALQFGKDANSSGVTSFVAVYQDGSQEHVSVEVPPVPGFDLLLLRGSRASDKPLAAAIAARCDIAYTLGCMPGSARVRIDRGVVAAAEPCAWYVAAHAGEGWSGGPVVNRNGRLLGLVQAGAGRDIKYVRIVSSELMQAFAVMHARPGFAT